MKRTLFILLMCLPVLLPAQQSPEKDSLATRFFRLNYPGDLAPQLIATDTTFTYRNLTFYNFGYPRGFVILRDQGGKYDITGYSFDQQFSFDVDTTGFLLSLAGAMTDASRVEGYAAARVPANLKTGRWAIEPLVKTTWNQGWPYNILCPADPSISAEDNHTLVGCVAVAMAQIIRYHDKWSQYGIYYSYEHPVFGTLTCNAGTYAWSEMENACYSVNFEVARLLYDCGVLVNMNYDREGSGASSENAANRLNQIYGSGYLNTQLQNEEEFYTNISNYMPIYTTYPGHAFVCDGYDGSGMYHFNLGWGGSANGYYTLSSVLGKNLTSAIFNAAPALPVNPPRHIRSNDPAGSQMQVSWMRPDQDLTTLTGYKIYLDDRYLADCTDTVYLHNCIPGDHYIKVSAQYSSGESRWIGPVSYFHHGSPVTVPDAILKRALNVAIGIPSAQTNSHVPTEGELSRILKLNVTNATDMTGLSACINLRQLTLYSATNTRTLDMGPLGECRVLANLSVENYNIANPVALANLNKLVTLKLIDNHLTDTEFLKSLALITRLEIYDNPVPDISFLNNMARVEYLTLRNCQVSGFGALTNTYGLRNIDISYNQVESLAWISGCPSLQSLNASNNKLDGSVTLTGMTVLTGINLSRNLITGFTLSGSPALETVNLSYNKISDITGLVTGNPGIVTLNASHNQIGVLPNISNQITRIEVQYNLIREITMLGRYSFLDYLNLSNNLITDLRGLTTTDYHKRLSYLNLLGNPISKESYTEVIPLLQAAGFTNIPATFFPGTPCYLDPNRDTALTTRQAHLAWQGDFSNEGYLFDVFLSKDGAPFDTIATGLDTRTLDRELPGLGKYSWYVMAKKDTLTLPSRTETFKVMKAFTIPFIEDFEIYNPVAPLVSQSPYWKIFGPVQDLTKDAALATGKAFDGNLSVKLSGIADIVFPVRDLLTGSCSAEFRMMVDRSRKAFFEVILNGGTVLSFFFYAEGNIEVYRGTTLVKYMTYKSREWIRVAVTYSSNADYKITIDTATAVEGKDGAPESPGITGIRFGTKDGPGNYQTLPIVYYIDNFLVLSGTVLSTSDIATGEPFPVQVSGYGGQLSLSGISPDICDIRVLASDGRLLWSSNRARMPSEMKVPVKEPFCILLLRDDSGKIFYKKILVLH